MMMGEWFQSIYENKSCVRFGFKGLQQGYERPIQLTTKPLGVVASPKPSLDSAPKIDTLYLTLPEQLKAYRKDATSPLSGFAWNVLAHYLQKVNVFRDDWQRIFVFKKEAPANRPKGKWGNPHSGWTEPLKQGLGLLPSKTKNLVVHVPDELSSQESVYHDLSEAFIQHGYNPYYYRQKSHNPIQLQEVSIQVPADKTLMAQSAINMGLKIGRGINFARFLVDAPSNIKTPSWMMEQAKTLNSPTLHVETFDKSWITQQKMGLFLSVAKGNTPEQTPKLGQLIYTPANGRFDKTILLVGKGIIFDTGGVNLKSGKGNDGKPYIHGMHGDMAGAAAVLGAMGTIDEMQIEGVRVIGLVPLTPNLIGSGASRPHDQAVARNGKSVEILNTDAEGRLVLADAIHYGGETFNPDLIVDIATLTGGKVAALGEQNSVAVMGNQHDWVKRVTQLEKSMGRVAQSVPLSKAHHNWVTRGGRGKFDVYNSVRMAEAERFNLYGPNVKYDAKKHIIHHAAQGGAFIREFLHRPSTPWIHLDMAGAEFEEIAGRGGESYATGFGVKDLVQIVRMISPAQPTSSA